MEHETGGGWDGTLVMGTTEGGLVEVVAIIG